MSNKQIILTEHDEFFIVQPLQPPAVEVSPPEPDDPALCLTTQAHTQFVVNSPVDDATACAGLVFQKIVSSNLPIVG
ncbi:unknown [Antheraea pernyi nucleopolyhedrovirus]|uniref:Uncharacterized protein n=2 Tax=Antheraea pernyi nuclear polyhedrosis virus TaxID=161494 RepID=Q1HH93_NPVAP|nr:hypothetical protein APNV_p004 [Antheraea pernyi nucleopolyhedrovirus]AWD33669.1 hypothetical protein [Antheraea proylei nucleopolyhedrovirus]BBD50458.1 hypothetical protein [Antheraea yamamai nucleopolyhedrovirus]BBD50610.1 hypothetical protein [Samia cynthia nucleopolyhedrovirus]ABF50246.1 unknown [Antheraea pernyi nucleopolyhedrovirus]ABQ12232.1 unknown [Antheraea pernyi nucleopolyhedrovirus]